ncbi:MAG TPA: EAL domain-containing protein [Acidimicrobiia bacterium]|jgi:diguanylate cyclase (GGDEF)-like protein
MLRSPGRELSDAVRVACLDQVNRALVRSALIGIPASALLAVILGSAVPLSRRVLFVALVTVADLWTFFAARRYEALRRAGEQLGTYTIGLLGAGATGLAWGSLSFLGFPDNQHVQLRTVYLLFVVGCSATYIVGAAARRSYFYAPLVPMLGLVMIRCLSSGERVTTLLGVAVPIYFAVMASLHHEVHTVVVKELELRERNDETNSRLVEANTRLTELAMRDPLTGLANRAAFIEHLERAVASARRCDTKIGVLYFDIDRFKVVNDSLGHAAGDHLLTDVAHRVTDLLRTNDVLARLGGDEFTICLDGVESVAQAVVVARRIADAFIAPFRVAGRSLNVSASIGVATNYHMDDGAEALLSHADVAQYRAKQNGRNRVEVFDVELRESIQRRVDDEQELRDALALGQIVAYYQPQFDLVTREIVGAEALARWKHPDRGVLAAGAFVPLAEDSGIVFALDGKIIGDAVNARVRLRDKGLDDSFRIWCNISARQLARGAPAEQLTALLARAGCSPSAIGIELTETAVLPDVHAAAVHIGQARRLGVKVALDDFGTGHSSLTLLRSLEIDAVKIDRSFVQDITIDRTDAAIVRSVILLAHDLGLNVVAEGVETQEQAEMLVQLGCRRAQGFLYSEAVSFNTLMRALEAQHTVAA